MQAASVNKVERIIDGVIVIRKKKNERGGASSGPGSIFMFRNTNKRWEMNFDKDPSTKFNHFCF